MTCADPAELLAQSEAISGLHCCRRIYAIASCDIYYRSRHAYVHTHACAYAHTYVTALRCCCSRSRAPCRVISDCVTVLSTLPYRYSMITTSFLIQRAAKNHLCTCPLYWPLFGPCWPTAGPYHVALCMAPTWPKGFFGPGQGHRLGQTVGQSQFGPHLAYPWR